MCAYDELDNVLTFKREKNRYVGPILCRTGLTVLGIHSIVCCATLTILPFLFFRFCFAPLQQHFTLRLNTHKFYNKSIINISVSR